MRLPVFKAGAIDRLDHLSSFAGIYRPARLMRTTLGAAEPVTHPYQRLIKRNEITKDKNR